MVKIPDNKLYSVGRVIEGIKKSYTNMTDYRRIIEDGKLKEYLIEKEEEFFLALNSSDEELLLPSIYDNLEHENTCLVTEFNITKDIFTSFFNTKDRFEREEFITALDGIFNCPICDGPRAKELDHYLPKSQFHAFIITPINLVPQCHNCNSNKKEYFNNMKLYAPFHPYFESYDFKRYAKALIHINNNDEFNINIVVENNDQEDLTFIKHKNNYEKIFKLDEQYDELAAQVLYSYLHSLIDLVDDLEEEILKEMLTSEMIKLSSDDDFYFSKNYIKHLIFKALLEEFDNKLYQVFINSILKIKEKEDLENMERELIY